MVGCGRKLTTGDWVAVGQDSNPNVVYRKYVWDNIAHGGSATEGEGLRYIRCGGAESSTGLARGTAYWQYFCRQCAKRLGYLW